MRTNIEQQIELQPVYYRQVNNLYSYLKVRILVLGNLWLLKTSIMKFRTIIIVAEAQYV